MPGKKWEARPLGSRDSVGMENVADGWRSAHWMPSRKKAFRGVLFYVIAGALWLLISDWLVGYFVHSKNEAEMVDVVGDLLYVIITGIMLV
jgi:hypothetical protein